MDALRDAVRTALRSSGTVVTASASCWGSTKPTMACRGEHTQNWKTTRMLQDERTSNGVMASAISGL